MFKKSISVFTAVLMIVLMSVSAFGTVVSASDYSTYELVLLVDKNSNTAVLTATLPANVASGKIVVDTTSKLTLKTGTLVSDISTYLSEDYDREGVTGLSVAFAKNSAYDEGTVVFTAVYNVNADVNSITGDDLVVSLWNLSNGSVRIATQEKGDVNKTIRVVENYTVTFNAGVGGSVAGDTQISVPAGTAVADILPKLAEGGLVFDEGYGFKSYSVTEGTVDGDMTIDISFYKIGDVNGDGSADNLDAAYVLRHDAQLITLDADQSLAADVNFDGSINSLDAANILKFDAGLNGPFVYLIQ